jgi:hypothetical protein
MKNEKTRCMRLLNSSDAPLAPFTPAASTLILVVVAFV